MQVEHYIEGMNLKKSRFSIFFLFFFSSSPHNQIFRREDNVFQAPGTQFWLHFGRRSTKFNREKEGETTL